HRGQRILAGDLDLAHVADVEQAGARTHRGVLGDDARVLDRHVPAAKRHHPRAGGAVASVERRFLERCVGRLFHWGAAAVSETRKGTMRVSAGQPRLRGSENSETRRTFQTIVSSGTTAAAAAGAAAGVDSLAPSSWPKRR